MSYFEWIILLFVLALINAAIAFNRIKNFLAKHRVIDTPGTFNEFKQLVRTQMYQALFQMAILLPMGFLGGYGIVTHKITTKEFIIFLLLNAVVFMVGKMGKGNEERARSMKVIDPLMETQYRAVCESWVGRALPTF